MTEREPQPNWEHSRRTSDERFHYLVDAVKDYAIFMLDPAGHVASWNSGAERIKGYRREEILGQSFSLFYTAEDRAEGRPELNLKNAAELGSTEDVGWRLRKDGSRFLAEVKIYALRGESGALRGFAKVTRDVTNLQRVREQEAVAHLGQLALSTPDLSALRNEVVATVARTLQMELSEILELAEDGSELVQRAGVGWKDGLKGIRVETGPASMAAVTLLSREPIVVDDFRTESRFQRPPFLSEHGVISSLSAAILGQNRPFGILGVHSTQRRKFSTEDVHFLQSVANILAAAIEKDRLIRALELTNLNKDQFLAVLSHELRNPLAAIHNLIPIIARHAPEHPRLERARTILERQVRLLTRLVDDLLDVTLVTTGKIQLRKDQIELRTSVERAVESVRPRIGARHQRLELTLPAEPVWLEADPTRLEQVIVNLLDNAAKYTGEGGAITVHAEVAEGTAVIRVRDTGVGIDPEMLPRIFGLFAQVNTDLSRGQSGMGIGLALVRRLVELHGGTVEASSAGPGQGSEFVVRLPIVISERASSRVVDATAEPTGRPLRVLVIDDNPDSADSLALLIRMYGHEARAEHGGIAGIDAFSEFQPDVVILDLAMPLLDGYEVAARLKEMGNGSVPVLVALTGYGQEEDIQRSNESGFARHMVKPVDPRELRAMLASFAASAEQMQRADARTALGS